MRMNSPTTNSDDASSGLDAGQAAAATAAIFFVASLAWGARFYFAASTPEPAPTQAPVVDASTPAVAPVDREALRRRAWDLVQARLDAADAASRAALDEQLAGVDEFFGNCRSGARPFAVEVLSVWGKLAYARSKLPTAADNAHVEYLNARFEEHIFKFADLQTLAERAIAGYRSRLEGLEGSLLVEIRADLSDEVFAPAGFAEVLHNDAAPRNAFEGAMADARRRAVVETYATLAHETTSQIVGQIAARIAVRIAQTVAARLGVSAGVLGAGAASSWGTFGLGLVAAVGVDVALTQVTKLAGYDPVARVTERMEAALEQSRRTMIEGDADAWAAYQEMREKQSSDPDKEVRVIMRECADQIDAGGQLGLKHALEGIHTVRSRLRRDTLRRLIVGETTM